MDNAGDTVLYYARVIQDARRRASGTAVVVFYRPPSCIPATFNLRVFFDTRHAPACKPATMAGYAVWKHGPGVDAASLVTKLHGQGAATRPGTSLGALSHHCDSDFSRVLGACSGSGSQRAVSGILVVSDAGKHKGRHGSRVAI